MSVSYVWTEYFPTLSPGSHPSLTHWRQRLAEEPLVALIQESLSVEHQTGAVVDTTVQPKAIAHPTDARLCYRAGKAGRSGAAQ
jgi:hypothetical protein